MNDFCDHCGKETSHIHRSNQITWCANCIKENADTLRKLDLTAFSRHEIGDAIRAERGQSFGLKENLERLGTIPKKLQLINKLPLGTRVKLKDNRLGSGQEGIIVARQRAADDQFTTHVLGWNTETDHDTGDGSNYSLESFEHIEDHNCNRFLSVAYDRMVEVIPPKAQTPQQDPNPPTMQLKDTKLGDTVRFVGTSYYYGCVGTVIADSTDGYTKAIGIKSKENRTERYFYPLSYHSFAGSGREHLPEHEINAFDKYLWFTADAYQVEVVPKETVENKKRVEVLESEDKMAVNVNTLQAGQEINHPKYGSMVVLGTYSGSGERLLGKKDKFEGSTASHLRNATNVSYVYWDKYDGTNYHVKWFAASEQVEAVGDRILKFGLKIGDKIEIFKKKTYDGLMDSGYEPDLEAPKVVGTVVGFNSNGEPNVYLDAPGTSKDRLNGYNSGLIDKHFLDNKSFMDKVNKNPNNFWLIRTDKAFNKLKERNMEDKKETKTFIEMMKGDATNAAYRVAANQMTKGVKSGILAMLEKNGSDGTKLKAVSEMLDTELGAAVVSMILGMALTYVPHVSNDPRAQRLAGEFRVEGMAKAGNTIMDAAIEHFLPVLTGALNSLPQETSVRVAEAPKAESNNHLSLEQAIREEEEKSSEKTDQVMKA